MVRDPKTCKRLIRAKADRLIQKIMMKYGSDHDLCEDCRVLNEVGGWEEEGGGRRREERGGRRRREERGERRRQCITWLCMIHH